MRDVFEIQQIVEPRSDLGQDPVALDRLVREARLSPPRGSTLEMGPRRAGRNHQAV